MASRSIPFGANSPTSSGGKTAYEKIRSSDESGTHPGAEAIGQPLKDSSPCLILIDEWVAYLRDTITSDKLATGGFESNYGFAQALTEAAKVVPGALVVASLSASRIEMGGERGEQAFEQLSNLFKRVATPWQSASTEDGYEIVRRRLFGSNIDFANRDAVVKAFYELYSGNGSVFPSNCSEQEYKRKLEACYPIHPELFDKLDSVWSTLEKFQKTRGVLRFMAGVIAELWRREDHNLLLMPASVPLDDPNVLNVVSEVLPSGSNCTSVINADIDGQAATANIIDSEHKTTLGRYSACRRVARTVFMGAAPTSGANKGIDDKHLLLGCTHPGENSEKFGDAFSAYLYFPRLIGDHLLEQAIQRAFIGGQLLCEYFGYADGFDPDAGKYPSLWATQAPSFVSIGTSVLVKPEIANNHAPTGNGTKTTTGEITTGGETAGGDTTDITTIPGETAGGTTTTAPPQAPLLRNRRTRSRPPIKVTPRNDGRGNYPPLCPPHGSKVKLSLEIEATDEGAGYDEATVRSVSENAKVKGVTSQDFE